MGEDKSRLLLKLIIECGNLLNGKNIHQIFVNKMNSHKQQNPLGIPNHQEVRILPAAKMRFTAPILPGAIGHSHSFLQFGQFVVKEKQIITQF